MGIYKAAVQQMERHWGRDDGTNVKNRADMWDNLPSVLSTDVNFAEESRLLPEVPCIT